MTSMMVKDKPIAKSRSFFLKNRVTSAMNNWKHLWRSYKLQYFITVLPFSEITVMDSLYYN
jgi:hypothetical protein